MSENVKTVQAIYDCFGKGDIEGLLAYLDPEVRWDADWGMSPPALYAARIGREEVPDFFAGLADFDFIRFEPQVFLAQDDWVAVPIEFEFRHKPSGKSIADLEVHLWRFGSDGKVVFLRHVLDGRLFEFD